jgi:hypothetical protein
MEILADMDRKAVLVVNGQLVEGIEGPVAGRIREGHLAEHFVRTETGRDKAVYFTKDEEMSDGVVRRTRV